MPEAIDPRCEARKREGRKVSNTRRSPDFSDFAPFAFLGVFALKIPFTQAFTVRFAASVLRQRKPGTTAIAMSTSWLIAKPTSHTKARSMKP